MKRMLHRSGVLVALTLVAAATAGCDSIFGPGDNTLLRDQLASAETTWQQAAVTSYSMVVARGPLYAEGHRAVLVEVTNRQITSATYVDDGTPVEPAVLAEHQTVEGMFEVVRDALNRRAPGIFVRYDDEFGFPSMIQVDYDVNRIGEDIYIGVSDFASAQG